MSEKTLRDTYGHHHPDYLRTAASAIGTRQAPSKNETLVLSLASMTSKRNELPEAAEKAGGPSSIRIELYV
jgi:hypothetical protein